MQSFEICRPGTFMDASGRIIPVTEDALREMALGYNTKVRRAPLVVGHPKTDDPAYGWVRELEYRDGALLALPEQVDEKFEDAVKGGRFPNRSAAFFVPSTPNNPTPGRYYLKHVGFLGAAQPAVDGLRPVEFSAFDDDDGHELVVSLAGYEGYIRHHERQRIVRENEIISLADKLMGRLDGNVIIRPYERDIFITLASHISSANTVVYFRSGEDEEQTDALTLLMRLMEARQPLVTLGEFDRGNHAIDSAANLSMPSGMVTDKARADLHTRALHYQKQHDCSYRCAVLAVSK